MRFLALCFTLLSACSGRQEPKCFECGLDEQWALAGAEERKRNTEVPTKETAPAPPDLLTLDKLFASGKVVIGQRGECESWSVTSDPEEPENPALEHPWSDIDEDKTDEDDIECTGFSLLRFVLADDSILIYPPTNNRVSCTGTRGLVRGVLGCGPSTWQVHKRSGEAITLVLRWEVIPGDDPAFKPKRLPFQTWYLSEAACQAEQHIPLLGGCN